MKRQITGDDASASAAAAAATEVEDTATVRKKSKRDIEKVEEEANKSGVESAPAVAENWLDWEELTLLTRDVVVDEQMSWGYFSLPIWGVEAYGSLLGDVVWDDDIWNLMSIKEIP